LTARTEATVSLAEARPRALTLLDGPAPLLVVSDFDGTLAQISLDPMGSVIEPLGRAALRRLARIAVARPDLLRVAVLSGRGAVDVASRVRVGGLVFHGNHGLEVGRLSVRGRPEALRVEFDPRFAAESEAFGRLATAVAGELGHPAWLFVEVKGPSVAFHFRQAPDPDAALRAIDAALPTALARPGMPDVERYDGRKVVEFRPPGSGGKGAAMRRLLEDESPGSVLVLGDDRSDAEAFAVLLEARAAGLVSGLAVGVHGSVETPPEILGRADLVLGGPHDAARLLSALGRALERRIAPRAKAREAASPSSRRTPSPRRTSRRS
jgi:trehalose 6-phosphate phosphatase